MKHVIIGAFLSICVSSSLASPWKITEVIDNKTVVGHIMHTYAKGTTSAPESKQKFATGLRFICAADPADPPIMGIYWDNPDSRTYYPVYVTIDGQSYNPEIWVKDESLMFVPGSRVSELIQKIKSSKSVKFHWLDQNSNSYRVIFDLEGAKFAEFNKLCKTAL